jgi:hypothetical protein
MIDIEEAVYFLMPSARFENEAGADTKVSWIKEGQNVGSAKFKGSSGSVTIKIEDREQVFKGEDAARLKKLGVLQGN